MTVLILGGSKFLGYHLVGALLRLGIKVTVFNRGITPASWEGEVERVTGDRKNHREFFDQFHKRRFDAVIDLIGYDREEIVVTEKTFKGYIGKYIFISTGQVYLVTENKHLPAREEDFYQKLIPCPAGEELPYHYGVRKRQIEQFLEERFSQARFPAIRLRCPVIHGPRDYTLRLYSYLLRIQDGHPLIIPDDGDTIIRHVFVGDVVRAIVILLQREGFSGEVFNLAQSEIMRLTEFLGLLADIMQLEIGIRRIAREELHLQGIPADISPFSGRWVSFIDPARATEMLGFSATPIENWLPETIRYFREVYEGPVPENYRCRPREIQLLQGRETG